MTSLLRIRFASWLGLAIALFGALSPAQGFVVCVEEDGCLHVELALHAELAAQSNEYRGCGDCADHDDGDDEARASDGDAQDAASSCSDYVAPGVPHGLPCASARIAPHALAEVARASIANSPFEAAAASRAPPREAPRPPPLLRHIRTVVIRD